MSTLVATHLRARGLLQRKVRRREPPPVRFPRAARVSYLRDLRHVLAQLRAVLEQHVVRELPRLVQAHMATRPDSAEVRLDETGSNIADLLDRAKKAIGDGIPRARIGMLAQDNALRVAAHNKAEVEGQVRTGLGIDVSAPDVGLGPHIEAFVEQNIALIQSLTGETLTQCHSVVLTGIRQGLRHEVIAKQLAERLGVAEKRAALIATDQVGKLNGELTQLRQTSLGIKRYKWSTSNDERVRKSHRALNQSLQRWDKPPIVDGQPAHPGAPVRCRCSAIPVLDDLLEAAGLPTLGDELPPVPPGLPKPPPANVPKRRPRKRKLPKVPATVPQPPPANAPGRLQSPGGGPPAGGGPPGGPPAPPPGTGPLRGVPKPSSAIVRRAAKLPLRTATNYPRPSAKELDAMTWSQRKAARYAPTLNLIGKPKSRDEFAAWLSLWSDDVDAPLAARTATAVFGSGGSLRDGYLATQALLRAHIEELAAAGVVDEAGYVTLYRGVYGPLGRQVREVAAGRLRIPARGASSWSESADVAYDFALQGQDGVVVRQKLHISRALATHRTVGISPQEREWIMLADDGIVEVEVWKLTR